MITPGFKTLLLRQAMSSERLHSVSSGRAVTAQGCKFAASDGWDSSETNGLEASGRPFSVGSQATDSLRSLWCGLYS